MRLPFTRYFKGKKLRSNPPPLFEGQSHHLIFHFSYHKCMTSFFQKVYGQIGQEFGFFHKHYNAVWDDFRKEALAKDRKIKILSVNNVPIDLDGIPEYRGTHLIRDPRDLLVSGYKYHLWCNEEWVKIPMSDKFKSMICLNELSVSNDVSESYQQLLNRVDSTSGYFLEYHWRKRHYNQMLNWDYSNPDILEIKYEQLFNNEVNIFETIFRHIGVQEKLIEKCKSVVERHSFKNLKEQGKTGNRMHASKGIPNQWQSEIPDTISDLFHREQSKLIKLLDY